MTPRALAAAELIELCEMVPGALHKIAVAHGDRLERLGLLHERLQVWALAKTAAAEALGPAQDSQNAPVTESPPEAAMEAQEATGIPQAPRQHLPQAAAGRTLSELMGTPDVQKWFRGSVGGLAKRGNIPYALLSPDQDPQTNIDKEQLKAILTKMLAHQG